MNEQEQCPKCGAAVGLGRLRWDNAPFVEILWDEEPFVADAHVELDDTAAQVELSVVACVSCGHITDVFNESGLQQTLTTLRAENERLKKERDQARKERDTQQAGRLRAEQERNVAAQGEPKC